MIKSWTKSWNSLLDDRALIMIRIFIKRFNSLRNTIKYLTKLSYSVPNTRWSNRLLNDRIPAPVIQVLTKRSTSLHDTIPHQFMKFFTKRLNSLLNYKIPSVRRLAIRRARREKDDFRLPATQHIQVATLQALALWPHWRPQPFSSFCCQTHKPL